MNGNGNDHSNRRRPNRVEALSPPAPAPERPTHTPHPLFELVDGEQERRDIQTLSFKRKNAQGELITHPELIPAREVTSWADVALWWGGGHYLVTARSATGHFAAQFPPPGKLHFIDGPEKPFVVRACIPIADASPSPNATTAPPEGAVDWNAPIFSPDAGVAYVTFHRASSSTHSDVCPRVFLVGEIPVVGRGGTALGGRSVPGVRRG